MHLDLKPENMMYFRESDSEKTDGELILKAIDFSTSELLSEKGRKLTPAELENRANLGRNIGHAAGSQAYSGPEIRFPYTSYWGDRAEDISETHPQKVIKT
jgi:serine/threonine protein kinase